VGDDGEIGAGGLVRFSAALFPVVQCAEQDVVAGREFFLRETERGAMF